MRIATVEQSRRIDETAQNEFDLPGETLMEAAGALSAREIQQSFYPEIRAGGVGVICGPGNNGGDGLVVARHLHSSGVKGLKVFVLAPEGKRSDLFNLQLKRLERLDIETVLLDSTPVKGAAGRGPASGGKALFDGLRLLIDAIFGIGLRAEVKEPYRSLIEAINDSRLAVASLDAPSGLDADRGTINGVAVKAALTLTFGLAKPGFFVNEGPGRVGRIRVLPIGFPKELFRREASSHVAFDERMAVRARPRRGATSNKTTHGHAAIFAGRPGMWGAGLLASGAAYRVGAGYVTLASFDEPTPVLAEGPEILTSRIEDEKLWANPRWRVAAVGPGLGTGEETARLLERLRERTERGELDSVVVDADAITVAAARKLFPLPGSWVMTPHAGELSRVLGVSAKEIESDRFRFAREGAKAAGCHVVLKGFRTVISDGTKQVVILAGNSALGKAGTGDVLTGMITGLLAQKLPPLRAASLGAWLHGRMADEWLRDGNGRESLEAGDLGKLLPPLLGRLAHGTSL